MLARMSGQPHDPGASGTVGLAGSSRERRERRMQVPAERVSLRDARLHAQPPDREAWVAGMPLTTDVSGSSADVEKDFEAVLSGGQDVCPDDVNGIAYTRWSNCDEPPDLQNADPERFKVTYREVKCGIEPLPDMTLCGSTRYQTKTCRWVESLPLTLAISSTTSTRRTAMW